MPVKRTGWNPRRAPRRGSSGSPTADRLGYGGVPVPEELRTLHRDLTGDQNARVRADLVLFPTGSGGAVFSTGSIAWVCAPSCNGYDNGVARLTGNVPRRLLDPRPLDD